MNQNGTIFDDLLKSKTLFKNKDALRSTYVPDILPHRNEEIRNIALEIAPAFNGTIPSNILIYGKTGTGKTAVVKHIGQEIEKKVLTTRLATLSKKIMDLHEEIHPDDYVARQVGMYVGDGAVTGDSFRDVPLDKVNFIYINCQHVDTEYRVLANIANNFVSTWKEKVPFTGLHKDEVYNRLQYFLDRNGGITIIVLDEVDKLVVKAGDDILYDLTRINTTLTRGKVAIIGISNDLNFTSFLEARVKSSLGATEMVFPPYNAVQLQDILKERANAAIVDGAIDDDVIQLCAALAAAEHGDARRALDLMRAAAEVAQQRNSDRILETHVREAINKLERNKIEEVLRTLPPHSKILLTAIMALRESGNNRITTGDLNTMYRELCGYFHYEPLGSRRVTDLISEMDMLSLISARIVSFGRTGGRTKIINLNISSLQLKNVFSQEDWLAEYINSKRMGSKRKTLDKYTL